MAGLPVHITNGGNIRRVCFFAEDDYRFFRDHLGKLAKRFHCSCTLKSSPYRPALTLH